MDEFKGRTPEIVDLIHQAAGQFKVDPKIINAIVGVESEFNPRARSPVGAKGLMQLSPLIVKHFKVKNPFDPQQNLMAGAQYFAELHQQYNDLEKALSHYYGGPKAIGSTGAKRYIKKVKSLIGD